MNARIIVFIILSTSALWVAGTSLIGLYSASIYQEYYSHIILIPFVSAYFLYESRKEIFTDSQFAFGPGIAAMVAGALLFAAGLNMDYLNQNDLTSITVLSAVVFLNGAFLAMFGLRAFKAALFPLLFLVFAAPIPSAVMDGIITFLQVGSTEFVELLFMATGTSYVREGFVFHLPGLSIEVAKQCSGIRSGLALFITSILAGHMFLKTRWKIVLLVLLTIPLTMFKNGIRITTLSIMSIHIDPRIIQSSLHREGGIPFFILALCLMAPILFWLRRTDIKAGKIQSRAAGGNQESLLAPVMRFFRKG
jgi:exosortase